MKRKNPKAFPIDDKRIYDAYIAGRMSAALTVGVRSGLFDRLDERPRALPALADRLGFALRPLRSLMTALESMGLVREVDEEFHLADDSAAYLVRGKKGWLGGLIDMEMEHFLSPKVLMDAMVSNSSSVYGDEDPWERHVIDPERARQFTAAMHSVSERPAEGFAESIDLSGVTRLLDVGGGSGALSVALARRFPNLSCCLFDLEVVCDIAQDYIKPAGIVDRVSTHSGDMFGDPWPRGFDAVLLSQILHDWPKEKGLQLLRSAFDALESGGRILIHEKLVSESSRQPLSNALVNLDMLVWTEGQQFSQEELRTMLAEAGFESIACEETAGYWSVVSGIKPTP